MKTRPVSLLRDDDGATVVEYSVLIALIIAGCIAIIGILGAQIQNSFQQISDLWTAAGGG